MKAVIIALIIMMVAYGYLLMHVAIATGVMK